MKRLTLYVICLSICVMACGMPVLSVVPESVNKDASIITDTQIEPKTSTAVMAVCRVDAESGGLHVRPAAGDLSTYSQTLNGGDTVTVLLPAIVAEDMGLWYELADGGFVNSKYLCNYVYP